MSNPGGIQAALARLEAALAENTRVIQEHTQLIAQRREWQGKLVTSIEVIKQLTGQEEDEPSAFGGSDREESDVKSDDGSAPKPSQTRKSIRSRSPMVLRAEEELIRMLREGGDYIKQLDAVNRLRLEHGILVGSGAVGRETSDLSAALGSGKSAHLRVSRRFGWELTEWGGLPPKHREARPDPGQNGPDGPDADEAHGEEIVTADGSAAVHDEPNEQESSIGN